MPAIRFLGHACFELTEAEVNVLIDPFLTGNPKAAATADEVDPTHIFVTHGHADHYGDVVDIAKRTGAEVVTVVETAGKTIYHLGDTALFSDMGLVKRRHPVDVALVPIGGHYTMDRWDAVIACDFIEADRVIPCHYDTFPAIEADAEAFKADVERDTPSEVVILQPGETYEA